MKSTMPANPLQSSGRWLCFTVLGTLLFVPLLPGLSGGRSEHTERRKQVEAMSQPEQQSLRRNFDVWKQLSDKEREGFREFHREIEEDAKQQGDLRRVMNAYFEWVQTLSELRRDELFDESDVNKRVEMVKKIQEDSQRSWRGWSGTRGGYPFFFGMGNRYGRPRRSFFGPQSKLSHEDLRNIMSTVEDQASISDIQRQALQPLDGMERYLTLLDMLHRSKSDERAPRFNPMPWADEKLVDQMVEVISDAALGSSLQELNEFERRGRLSWLLGFTLLGEGLADLKSRLPDKSERELSKDFRSMDDERRQDLFKNPAEGDAKLRLLIENIPDEAERKSTEEYWKRFRTVLEESFPFLQRPDRNRDRERPSRFDIRGSGQPRGAPVQRPNGEFEGPPPRFQRRVP